jgi:peptidoglycan biosynthesis protein MviN/MurJ (putative lipid II flippase)
VRSGRGRNCEVLAVNTITLAVNVPLSIGLIAAFGLPGAAAALAISEFLQASLLWGTAAHAERVLVGRALAIAVVGAALLVLIAVALWHGQFLFAALAVVAAGALVVGRRPPGLRRVVAS